MAGLEDYESFDAAPPPPPPPAPPSGGVIPIVTGRPQVTVHPRAKATTLEDYEPFDSEDEKAREPPFREVGPGEAAARGFINMETYGLAPALYGAGAAGAAGKTPEEQNAMIAPGTDYPGGEMVGAGLHQIWHNHFGSDPNPVSREAYDQGRQSFLSSDQAAQDQHFVPYVLGQVGAALSAPETVAGGMMRAGLTKFIPRLLTAMGSGGGKAAAQATGETISQGRPEDIPVEAAKGAVTGGVLGAAGHLGAEAIGGVAQKVGTILRGHQGLADPDKLDAIAGKRVVDALSSDVQRFGPSMAPEVQAAAHQAETPLGLIDVGQGRTRALLRASANTSPEGRQTAETFLRSRFEQQSPRIAGFIRKTFGGSNASEEMDRIQAAKQAFNPPMYKRAYQAGDRPIWSPEIERLSGDPDIAKAIGKAARTGKSWAILDDMGGFNPSVKVTEDGQLIFNKGPTGVPTYPNIQFWDYVQRELRGEINAAKRADATSDVTRLTGLRNLLLKDLDRQVPEFGQARQTAASFFGAGDAVEAGENFVMGNFDRYEAAKMIAKFKPVERELFARSFAGELARKVESVPDSQDVLNKAFLRSVPARQKIEMALGPQGANQMEAMLRSEIVINKAYRELGNSTTARQVAELGMAGGGAVGAMEALKHTTLTGAILTALAGGTGVKKVMGHLAEIDENVSRRMAEMLVSDDPAILQRGIKAMAASPKWMKVLRAATGAGVRVGAPDIGFTNLAAGAIVGAEDIGDLFRKKEKAPPHETETQQYQDNTQ